MDPREIFDTIITHAKDNSTCKKLAVGSGFLDSNGTLYVESNRSSDFNCKNEGECYKAKVTGIYESVEWTRKYCKAIHAEINMINLLKSKGIDPSNGTLYVSRYPCENCARNCVEFGFKHIVYCGRQKISDEVNKIFKDADIEICWFPEIDYEY